MGCFAPGTADSETCRTAWPFVTCSKTRHPDCPTPPLARRYAFPGYAFLLPGSASLRLCPKPRVPMGMGSFRSVASNPCNAISNVL